MSHPTLVFHQFISSHSSQIPQDNNKKMTDHPDCIIIRLRKKKHKKEPVMQVILPEILTLEQYRCKYCEQSIFVRRIAVTVV